MELIPLFHISVSPYWRDHYLFDKHSAFRSKNLGLTAIHLILINTVIPFLFVYGKNRNDQGLVDRSLRLLDQLPGEVNTVVKKWETLGMSVRTAFNTQALIELKSNREFFEHAHRELDALLISAESGSAYTLFYPEYEVIVPEGPRIALPLFYAVGARDAELRRFLDYWVSLRKKDGTLQDHYEHWILGKRPAAATPRWCVIRDVLGWVK